MKAEDEFRKVVALFERLGSTTEQAETMAGQVIKRVDQWVEERDMNRIEAMNRILELLVAGRQGIAPPGFEGRKSDGGLGADEI